MTDEPETVYGACNKCRYVGEMKSRNGFLVHNQLGTDIECGYSGLELKGYGALSGDPVSEYLAKFAEEENVGRTSYSDGTTDHESKARAIAEEVLHGKFHFPALVPAIATALREERERCAETADSIGKDYVGEAVGAPNEKSKDTFLGWANGAFRVRDVLRSGSATDEQ